MKKFLFIISLFLVGIGQNLYCMAPAEEKRAAEPIAEERVVEPRRGDEPPRRIERPGRLFIKNNRTDAIRVAYQYGNVPELKDLVLQRVVYPQEVIWIGGPSMITSLKLSPHGDVKQLADPKLLTLGMIPGKDYATEIQSKISRVGGVEITISGYAYLSYKVDTHEKDTIDIARVISLIRCKWLGDIFTRAGEVFDDKKDIRPEYILGVPPKPSTMNPDYKISVDLAVEDLSSGWEAAKYGEGAGLISKKKLGELIRAAYRTLRSTGATVQEELAKFVTIARNLFAESKEALDKSCRI